MLQLRGEQFPFSLPHSLLYALFNIFVNKILHDVLLYTALIQHFSDLLFIEFLCRLDHISQQRLQHFQRILFRFNLLQQREDTCGFSPAPKANCPALQNVPLLSGKLPDADIACGHVGDDLQFAAEGIDNPAERADLHVILRFQFR